jgi:hypothetical protein
MPARGMYVGVHVHALGLTRSARWRPGARAGECGWPTWTGGGTPARNCRTEGQGGWGLKVAMRSTKEEAGANNTRAGERACVRSLLSGHSQSSLVVPPMHRQSAVYQKQYCSVGRDVRRSFTRRSVDSVDSVDAPFTSFVRSLLGTLKKPSVSPTLMVPWAHQAGR